MKAFIFPLILCFGFQISAAEEECEKYLDIRNYGKVDRSPEKSMALDVSIGTFNYSVTVVPRPGGTSRAQLIRHGIRDPLLEGVLANAVKTGDRTGKMKETLQSVAKQITKVYGDPEVLALPLKQKTNSERVKALREMFIKFYKENGLANADQRFFDLFLSRMQVNSFSRLTPMEWSYFDYSIFDDHLGYVAETRAEEVNKVWRELGVDPKAGFKEVHDSIRKKFISAGFGMDRLYNMQKNRIQEVLNKMSRSIDFYDPNEGANWSFFRTREESIPEDIKPFINRRLSKDDIPELITLMQKYQFRNISWEDGMALAISNPKSNSNVNPFEMDVDHAGKVVRPRVYYREEKLTDSWASRAASIPEGALGPGVGESVGRNLDRTALETASSEEQASDSMALVEDEIEDREVVELLKQQGIHHIYEITRHSAADFVDNFNFSTTQMDRLLDELNALGVHLHFDSKWDRKPENRIRKRRPEFYEFKHVPNQVVKWSQVPSPTEDLRTQTQPNKGPTQKP